MRQKRINDGSKNGVIAYYCGCGRCNFWDIVKEIVEKIEKLHLEKNQLIKKHQLELKPFQEQEWKILGIKPVDLSKYRINEKE